MLAFKKIILSDENKDDIILCVGHGATVKVGVICNTYHNNRHNVSQ
jgi:hypothetical protein